MNPPRIRLPLVATLRCALLAKEVSEEIEGSAGS
jgi:hypothetical protein